MYHRRFRGEKDPKLTSSSSSAITSILFNSIPKSNSPLARKALFVSTVFPTKTGNDRVKQQRRWWVVFSLSWHRILSIRVSITTEEKQRGLTIQNFISNDQTSSILYDLAGRWDGRQGELRQFHVQNGSSGRHSSSLSGVSRTGERFQEMRGTSCCCC